MRGVVLDTCVIVHVVRDSPTGRRCLAALERGFGPGAAIAISAVTVAELRSFALQKDWGAAKTARLDAILGEMTCLDILSGDTALLRAYTLVDAYSKRKAPDGNGRMLAGAARKMGKNDLWIAAAALSLGLPLMTADGDFDHLGGTVLEVVKVA